jgi:site-specific DNA recombinase
VQRLLDELTQQGLETTPTAKRPARPLYLSHLHKLLRHPYYIGIVRYRGVQYEGRHEPLVTEQTWRRVQEVLSAHNQAGDRPRIHNHYLKGTVFCGKKDENGIECGCRLIVTHARSRSGRIYPYFVCSGRHNKRTRCTFKATLIDSVEDQIIDHYALHELTADQRDAFEPILGEELDALRQEAKTERAKLLTRQHRLLNERSKLLQAHYAEAVPLDLLKSEQRRIRDALANIDQKLASTDQQHEAIDANLKAALALATNAHAMYSAAPDSIRRRINQVFFTHVFVDDDGEVSSKLAEPFDILLSPEVRRLVAVRQQTERVGVPEPAWEAWEASFNEEGAHSFVGASQSRRLLPSRVGLNKETLVGAGGFEPP